MDHPVPEDPTRRQAPAEPPEPTDPRLEIPEVLRRPVDHPSKHRAPAPSSESGLGDLGKAVAMGLDFLFTAVAGGGLGYFADRWLGSSPTGLLIGLGVGFVAATVRLIQRSNAEDRKRAADRPRSPAGKR